MKTNDIKQIWKSANNDETTGKRYSLSEIQDYRKNKSHQMSTSGSRAIWFDIVFKGLIAAALLFLVVFQVTQPVYHQIIVVLVSVTILLLGVNFSYIKKLRAVKETDAIMENLKTKLHYFKTTFRNFIINSSLSNPLFVLTGFFFYYQFKYHEIRMELPWNDPVMYLFLLLAFFISFGAQWANYRSQVKELTETIEDLDNASLASVKISERRTKKRRNFIMYTILILLGLLIFLYIMR